MILLTYRFLGILLERRLAFRAHSRLISLTGCAPRCSPSRTSRPNLGLVLLRALEAVSATRGRGLGCISEQDLTRTADPFGGHIDRLKERAPLEAMGVFQAALRDQEGTERRELGAHLQWKKQKKLWGFLAYITCIQTQLSYIAHIGATSIRCLYYTLSSLMPSSAQSVFFLRLLAAKKMQIASRPRIDNV